MVQLGFYILTAIMIVAVFYLLNYGDQVQKLRKNAIFLLIVWIAYVVVMSFTGLLDNLSMPPKAPFLIILPAFIIVFITTSRRSFKKVIENTPKHIPVLIQVFRIIVELLIYGAFMEGFFPKRVTFEGLNYDIIMGILAIPVGLLIMKGTIDRQIILAYNILGLLVLSLTGYAFISSFYFSDFVSASGEIALVKTPFILLPGVLLPFAIFYHVVSIKQNLKARN
ncbi:hypothetical protein [Roseivirga misakiensis]|uniref:Uncharacterized protein n=1 Tax=Roseivirga misakiensis TaxID=1563681 RepID=A0A1E5T0C1_9BACT|nr:hypothetical protein [Roseivirga misakiensis]OEK04832.1 hypothetical protein BFP71_15440 [Roseivirga misakiensis]